jgi:hypothetical protein
VDEIPFAVDDSHSYRGKIAASHVEAMTHGPMCLQTNSPVRTRGLERWAVCVPDRFGRYLFSGFRAEPAIENSSAGKRRRPVGRQPYAVRVVFADGLNGMIRSIEEGLPANRGSARERAISLVTRMVGALMLARAVPDGAPLADELLHATLRSALRELGPFVGFNLAKSVTGSTENESMETK